MTDRFVAVGPNATIDEAVALMLEHRVSGLPVIDTERQLLGVISEIDIIKLIYEADIEASTVADYMTRDICALDAEASLDDAAGLFCRQAIRRFPVVRAGQLVGIVSRHDLIRFVRDVRKQTVTL